MCEYKMDEAKTLLNQNLQNAKNQIKKNNEDLEFIKDQMTVCEVNLAPNHKKTLSGEVISALAHKLLLTI